MTLKRAWLISKRKLCWGWRAWAGHAARVLWSSREGEKVGWCWTATGDSDVLSLLPLNQGGFLEAEEEKKAGKGEKEQEEKER